MMTDVYTLKLKLWGPPTAPFQSNPKQDYRVVEDLFLEKFVKMQGNSEEAWYYETRSEDGPPSDAGRGVPGPDCTAHRRVPQRQQLPGSLGPASPVRRLANETPLFNGDYATRE